MQIIAGFKTITNAMNKSILLKSIYILISNH